MRCFVTGGAGFIGSHLADRLLAEGHQVIVYDNLSLGKEDFIRHHYHNPQFTFVKADLLDFEHLKKAMEGAEIVFHLAANSDIVKSAQQTRIDLEQGTFATYNVLEAMRHTAVKKIVFTSSNVVYGEATRFPIPEDYGPLFPISMYGASKLACEGLMTAFCHNFSFQSWIYRFVNVIGQRVTHGIVLDFYKKLQKNPKELEILGNGQQSKPYIEVHDCVDGMLFGLQHSSDSVNLFNLGTEGRTSVMTVTKTILKELGLEDVKITFTGGIRGWPGDVPKVELDIGKLRRLGWKPAYTSDEAVQVGVKAIIKELKDKEVSRAQ